MLLDAASSMHYVRNHRLENSNKNVRNIEMRPAGVPPSREKRHFA